ncbi:MAG: cobalamin-dependent protein, partial [Phycisphaerales bacterium]
MSRVLLISTNTLQTPYPVYPLGMATAAAALIDAGHVVRQFDWLAANRQASLLEQVVSSFEPEVVAVSIRNVDHVDSLSEFGDTWELKEAAAVVGLVRRLTSAPVVVGGPAVSVMPHQVRDYVGAQVAV